MASEPLHSLGFMADTSPGLARLMESVATKVSLEPQDVLFEQGDAGDALYAIVSGALEVSVLSRDGRKLALDIFRTGALFGEIALFDPGPRTATVTAIEPCVLQKIKNAELLREIRSDPDLAGDLIRLAGERMRWMGDQLSEQVFLPMPTRLARRILHLTDTEHSTLTLSQSVLADHVGATREAVSKTMASWKKAGVISSLRGGMKVLDRSELRAIADLN